MNDHRRTAEQILRQLSKLSAMKELSAQALAGMAQAHATLAAATLTAAAVQTRSAVLREEAFLLRSEAGQHGDPGYDWETAPGMHQAAGRLERRAATLEAGGGRG